MTASPLISVIVLNHNGVRWLGPCLDALRAQTGAPPYEILVVDNGSTDGSADVVREHAATAGASLRLVQTGGNVGFAAGNNVGARVAGGTLLAFLNNDTLVSPDWLARLHDASVEHAGFDLVTSRIVFMENPDIVDSAGDGYLRAGGAFKRGYGQPARDYGISGEVFGACGAAFLIRRDVFEDLGGFDERFFIVYEDVDLSYRARLTGRRTWYAADAVVRHAGSGSIGRLSERAVFYGQRNLEWAWIKNTPRPLLWRTAAAHLVYSLAGLVYYARAGRLVPALRGKLEALYGMPGMLRTRREVQSRRIPHPALPLERSWLAVKRREKRRASSSIETVPPARS